MRDGVVGHEEKMICSRTKLGHELDKVKEILWENGHQEDIISTCFKGKICYFSARKSLV